MTTFDTRELDALAVDLTNLSASAVRPVLGVFREASHELKTKWAENARSTSGAHGKHYPNSIDWDQIGSGLTFEIGPNSAKPQGGMGPGFEYGSVNQPPHLDGQRAADDVIPHLERRILLAAEDVFDAL